jgi:hypothetical protein
MSAWSLLLGSLLLVISFFGLVLTTTEDQLGQLSYYNFFGFFLASCFVLIASIVLLVVSYPATFQRQLRTFRTAETSENFFVVASSLYFIASFAFWVWPIWATSMGELTTVESVFYIAAVVVGSALLAIL